MRHQNHGIRKLCDCARRNWAKCPHAWYFNFKPRGGKAYQFSLDAELDRHIETKEAAATEADRIRTEIRAGTFVRAADRLKASPSVTTSSDATTLETFATKYLTNKVQPSGKETWKNDEHMLNQLAAFVRADGSRLGAGALGAITEDDLEAFYASLRAKGRAVSTLNQYVQVLKDAFRWAAKKGYLTRNPISEDAALKRGTVAQRARRLVPDRLDNNDQVKAPGEERRLLAATMKNPGMQRLIIAALETGARRGELLALRWADVLETQTIYIRAVERGAKKTKKARELPMSSRLAGVLEMAKLDPAGHVYPPEAYVFGECGRRVQNTKRAWTNACTRAGVAELHFHDLRHEAASRWLEAGWPLHHIQAMLGHANIAQTSTYLNVERMGLHDSMRRFDPARCNSVVKPAAEEHLTDHNEMVQNREQVTVN